MAVMDIRRGDIYMADISIEGSIDKHRPVLVIQNDAGNKYAGHTIVAAIRHDTDKQLRVHVYIPKGIAELKKHSVVDCGHIATISKDILKQFIGHLPKQYMKQVDEALKTSLQIN